MKYRSSHQRCSVKKVFLKFCKIHRKTPVPESPLVCNFIKNETLAQVFSCVFSESFQNIFFHRTPTVAASGDKKIFIHI